MDIVRSTGDMGINLRYRTDHLVDSISASMLAIDCVKRVLLMKKAHIPLIKCFALSDFGWGSLCSTLPSPQATGQRWVYMIKKIQPEVVKKIQPVVEAPSFKLQA